MIKQLKLKQPKKFDDLTQEEKNEIIRKNGPIINEPLNYYLRMGGLWYYKEDLEQEGWKYVFRHWTKFDPMKAQRSTWIYNTFKQGLKNAVHKEYGKQKRQAVNLVEGGDYDKDKDSESIESIIEQLPKEYQEIVKDKAINNLTSRQITKKYKLFGSNETLKQILEKVEVLLTSF